MREKTMGSTGLYLTPRETAEVLGVSEPMVHVLGRRQYLEAYYPEGRKAGKRYRAEDVYTLAELRSAHKGELAHKLPQLAMKAIVTSRRVEKRLEELVNFLGLNDVVLSLEKDDIVSLHQKVEFTLSAPRLEDDLEIIDWARKLLAINEEYLDLVRLHLGEQTPWKPYADLARLLSGTAQARSRSFIDHARANLRNVAYFYECSYRGAREAGKMFPGERYAGRLLQRLQPI